MSRIYIPTSSADQWASLLAEPVKHWRLGYSARTLAYSWQEANGFPSEVAAVLAARFPDIELLLAFPEHQVPLPGGSRPSQSDIWVLARSAGSLVSIAVEGKVAEPFGPTVGEWCAAPSAGKTERLRFLCEKLGIEGPVPQTLRYQLLHRAASAVIEATRFGAAHAVMLVHSFSQTNDWFQDYAAFVAVLGGVAIENALVSVESRSGVALHLAWVHGDARYLSR